MTWKDLEEKVCGNLIVDVEWLKKNTDYVKLKNFNKKFFSLITAQQTLL